MNDTPADGTCRKLHERQQGVRGRNSRCFGHLGISLLSVRSILTGSFAFRSHNRGSSQLFPRAHTHSRVIRSRSRDISFDEYLFFISRTVRKELPLCFVLDPTIPSARKVLTNTRDGGSFFRNQTLRTRSLSFAPQSVKIGDPHTDTTFCACVARRKRNKTRY